MPTLAELEQQWEENCKALNEAHDRVRILAHQHVKLGEKIARAKQAARGPVVPRERPPERQPKPPPPPPRQPRLL